MTWTTVASEGSDAALVELTPAEQAELSLASAEADAHNVLHDVMVFLSDYVVFSSPHELVATTLWVAHTYLMDDFETTPRLAIKAPEKQTGKTRLLECLVLVCQQALLSMNTSAAAFVRIIDQAQPTMLLDEIDTVFGPDAGSEHADLRAIINAGYRKGSLWLRCTGVGANQQATPFKAYCAVATAGIGDPPVTIADRAVVINMRRKTSAERVKDYRTRIVAPRGAALSAQLATWSAGVAGGLLTVHVDDAGDLYRRLTVIPPGITDRQADIWEPLLMIADTAGSSWARAAREACIAMTAAQAVEDAVSSTALTLLRDLRGAWQPDAERMATADLIQRLRDVDESPWIAVEYGQPVLDGTKMAKLLKGYRVTPQRWHETPNGVRVDVRGYYRTELADAWERYL